MGVGLGQENSATAERLAQVLNPSFGAQQPLRVSACKADIRQMPGIQCMLNAGVDGGTLLRSIALQTICHPWNVRLQQQRQRVAGVQAVRLWIQ